MILAIASDLHDSLENLKKFIKYLKKEDISSLLFCGDLCRTETLEYLANNFPKKIHLIQGNADLFDSDEPSRFNNISYHGRFADLEIAKLKIAMIHEPFFVKKVNEGSDFIFYGHTHLPKLEKRGLSYFANPGTLRGELVQASFALLNTENKLLELKLLRDC